MKYLDAFKLCRVSITHYDNIFAIVVGCDHSSKMLLIRHEDNNCIYGTYRDNNIFYGDSVILWMPFVPGKYNLVASHRLVIVMTADAAKDEIKSLIEKLEL